MVTGRLSEVRKYVRNLFHLPDADLVPDGMLLERYVQQRDEAAFTALVQRYGSLVYGVCERVLPDCHDAEDAFQATFLVLVRRADTLDRQGPLGNWLYTVAYRTALKARANAAQRRAHEKEGQEMLAVEPEAETAWRELRPVLDEELNRLPEKYRAPLVLCYLEGKSHIEVARELGWPSGSISRRMARAQELLRDRLTRRGIAITGSLLVLLLGNKAGAATVSTVLTSATVKAGLVFGSEQVVATLKLSSVVKLAESVLRASARSTSWIGLNKRVLVALFAFGVLITFAAAAGVVGQHWFTTKPQHGPGWCGNPLPTDWQMQSSMDLTRGEILAIALSPDGQAMAVGGKPTNGNLQVWQGSEQWHRQSLPGHDGAVFAVAFSPDGRTFASAGQDRTIRLWNAATFREAGSLRGHTGAIMSLAFSLDGRALASGSVDKTIRLWDLTTGKERLILSGHTDAVSSLAFSTGAMLLASGSHDGTARLWDTVGGSQKATLTGHTAGIATIAFTPDGRQVATGSLDQTIRLWDVATGQHEATLTGHDDGVSGVGFAPDGNRLLSASHDGTLRVWDPSTKQQLMVLNEHQGAINALAVGAGSTVAATGSADQTVKVWHPY